MLPPCKRNIEAVLYICFNKRRIKSSYYHDLVAIYCNTSKGIFFKKFYISLICTDYKYFKLYRTAHD